jgi:hypothetical protein
MALAPEVTHRDLKHAQARTALQAAHHKLQAGQPIAALQVRWLEQLPLLYAHTAAYIVTDVSSQDLLTISRELGGQEAQTPLIQRYSSAKEAD